MIRMAQSVGLRQSVQPQSVLTRAATTDGSAAIGACGAAAIAAGALQRRGAQ